MEKKLDLIHRVLCITVLDSQKILLIMRVLQIAIPGHKRLRADQMEIFSMYGMHTMLPEVIRCGYACHYNENTLENSK